MPSNETFAWHEGKIVVVGIKGHYKNYPAKVIDAKDDKIIIWCETPVDAKSLPSVVYFCINVARIPPPFCSSLPSVVTLHNSGYTTCPSQNLFRF